MLNGIVVFIIVTTVTPMKRGLKADLANADHGFVASYNRFPDEKGTESLV